MFYSVVKFLVAMYYRLAFRLEIHGMENVPKNVGALICPNHFSNHDPLLIGTMIPGRKIYFMAKNEIFKNSLFKYFLTKLGTYPVKRGEADVTAIKTTLRILKENNLVGLFPEGKRIRDREFGEANPGVALFSIKSGKPVIPVLISGQYRLFNKIKIIFGQPIYLDEYKKAKMTNEDYVQISQVVMTKIKELKREEF